MRRRLENIRSKGESAEQTDGTAGFGKVWSKGESAEQTDCMDDLGQKTNQRGIQAAWLDLRMLQI